MPSICVPALKQATFKTNLRVLPPQWYGRLRSVRFLITQAKHTSIFTWSFVLSMMEIQITVRKKEIKKFLLHILPFVVDLQDNVIWL